MKTEFSKISTFIFDVDGVLTDGALHCFAEGEQVRSFNIKDGFAIDKALKSGYNILIISGALEEGVNKRLRYLGIRDIFLGVKDKIEVYEKYLMEKGIDKNSILYMGDDIPDLKVLKLAGLPACPADAALDVKEVCRYVSPYGGGRGAVRDVIERVMRAQGKWLKDQW